MGPWGSSDLTPCPSGEGPGEGIAGKSPGTLGQASLGRLSWRGDGLGQGTLAFVNPWGEAGPISSLTLVRLGL